MIFELAYSLNGNVRLVYDNGFYIVERRFIFRSNGGVLIGNDYWMQRATTWSRERGIETLETISRRGF